MKEDNNTFSKTFLVLTVIFCACLAVSNLLEIKTVDLGPMVITAGVLTFPISYIINDCLAEVYGYRKTRFVIWLGFAMNLIVVLFLQVGILLPGSDQWMHQRAMEVIFGATPRVLVASFVAFLCGSLVNARVMGYMKGQKPIGKGFSLRAVVSTILGEGVDSLIFFPAAFLGVFEFKHIVYLIVTQTLLKTVYEVIMLPITVQCVKLLRRREDKE